MVDGDNIVQIFFLPLTIPHNLQRFSEMIPRLKGSCTMADRTIMGGMLAKSLITHYRKERTEHYTLVDLLSTVKYIIKVPKTQKCSVLEMVG